MVTDGLIEVQDTTVVKIAMKEKQSRSQSSRTCVRQARPTDAYIHG